MIWKKFLQTLNDSFIGDSYKNDFNHVVWFGIDYFNYIHV